jgi:hypothetical protein
MNFAAKVIKIYPIQEYENIQQIIKALEKKLKILYKNT